MTKYQILVLRRHLKVACAAYEQQLAPANDAVIRVTLTEALEDARRMLVELDNMHPTD